MNGEDVLSALRHLGFEDYCEALTRDLSHFRELEVSYLALCQTKISFFFFLKGSRCLSREEKEKIVFKSWGLRAWFACKQIKPLTLKSTNLESCDLRVFHHKHFKKILTHTMQTMTLTIGWSDQARVIPGSSRGADWESPHTNSRTIPLWNLQGSWLNLSAAWHLGLWCHGSHWQTITHISHRIRLGLSTAAFWRGSPDFKVKLRIQENSLAEMQCRFF